LTYAFLWRIYTCNFIRIHTSKQKLEWKLKYFSRGITLKNHWNTTKFEIDLHIPMMYPICETVAVVMKENSTRTEWQNRVTLYVQGNFMAGHKK
jgi:hypothetical protein